MNALASSMSALRISVPSSAYEQNEMPTPRVDLRVATDDDLDYDIAEYERIVEHDENTARDTTETASARREARIQREVARDRLNCLRDMRETPIELRSAKPWLPKWRELLAMLERDLTAEKEGVRQKREAGRKSVAKIDRDTLSARVKGMKKALGMMDERTRFHMMND